MKLKITHAFFAFSLLLFLSINFSCGKIDIHPPIKVDSVLRSNNVLQKFFNSHLSSDENIVALRNNILRQNRHKPFVEKFVKFAGYPIWDKAISKRF